MTLPDNLERLKHISIDTLGLSDSTSALLKWNGITHVLDCIAFFYKTAQERNAGRPWIRLFGLMFDEVKPALITAGYWDLVLDAEVWRALKTHNYSIGDRLNRKLAHWQGKDQNLDKIPIERLGLSDLPVWVKQHYSTIGWCLDHFIDVLRDEPQYWAEIDQDNEHYNVTEPQYEFDRCMWGQVQPRLVALGLWAFVEAHVDDFEIEEEEVVYLDDGGDDVWETFEGDELPFRVMLMRLLIAPILIVAIGLRWIAQAVRSVGRSADEDT